MLGFNDGPGWHLEARTGCSAALPREPDLRAVADAGIDLRVLESGLWAQLTEDGLRGVLADHAQKISDCAMTTLDMAGVPAGKIGTVVFVGGSSLLHVVRDAMTALFPQAQQEQAEAFTAVANGLAMAAEMADAKR